MSGSESGVNKARNLSAELAPVSPERASVARLGHAKLKGLVFYSIIVIIVNIIIISSSSSSTCVCSGLFYGSV